MSCWMQQFNETQNKSRVNILLQLYSLKVAYTLSKTDFLRKVTTASFQIKKMLTFPKEKDLR